VAGRQGKGTAPAVVPGVVGFYEVFASIVETTIAKNESEAAMRQVVLMIPLDGVADHGESNPVHWAMPLRTSQILPHRPHSDRLRVSEGLDPHTGR